MKGFCSKCQTYVVVKETKLNKGTRTITIEACPVCDLALNAEEVIKVLQEDLDEQRWTK